MKDTKTLYQHGTLALLVPGLLEGTITMGELLKHGDTGIGTGEGLDGELIILDGIPYQVNSKGEINIVKDDFTMPFSTIHFADYTPLSTLKNVTMKQFENEILTAANANNAFYSVITKGTFKNIKTRAVAKSQKPYPTLVETAHSQSIFEAENISGTLLTYYSPKLFHGIAVGGFHTHFLADDYSIGGHVLDFTINEASADFQLLDTLQQHLPTNNKDFMNHNFDNDQIGSAIDEAEK